MKNRKTTCFKYFSLFFILIAFILITGCSGTPPSVPIINSFSADSPSITEGESSTLSWSVTEATTVTKEDLSMGWFDEFFNWWRKKKCRAIVVEDSILDGIRANLEELMELWRREGAQKIIVFRHPTGAGNSPFPIRQFLKSLDRKYDLEGVFIIGELPVAFFDETHASRHLLYTSDYFFMELEGSWSLSDGNIVSTPNKFPPTICAGRVFIGSDTGISATRPPVTEYYNRCLRKMIDFRMQGKEYRYGRKAVVVSNLGGVDAYRNHLVNLYPPPPLIDSFDGVTNTEYEEIIETEYDWILYYGHSFGITHSMANGTIWDQFDYHEAHIKINIFQFESCAVGVIAWHTPSDPSDPSSPLITNALSDTFISNILGNPNRGVLVLAPSIPGFFSDMDRFYSYLRSGDTFGKAFKKWMKREIEENDPHYMSLYGDPFLYFKPVDPSIYRERRSWWERLLDKIFGRGIIYI